MTCLLDIFNEVAEEAVCLPPRLGLQAWNQQHQPQSKDTAIKEQASLPHSWWGRGHDPHQNLCFSSSTDASVPEERWLWRRGSSHQEYSPCYKAPPADGQSGTGSWSCRYQSAASQSPRGPSPERPATPAPKNQPAMRTDPRMEARPGPMRDFLK